MKLADIQIRDPFVVSDADGHYCLFGSTDPDIWRSEAIGFDAYRSARPGSLDEWEGPFVTFRPAPGFWSRKNFWAPELHEYRGEHYLFATFLPEGPAADGTVSAGKRAGKQGVAEGGSAEGRAGRGTAILKSTAGILGPFEPWSSGTITPPSWECLDGTLYVDDAGDPWMVFCHEWQQVGDGTVEAVRLSQDLRRAVGDPTTLFSASEAPWAAPLAGRAEGSYVTDGPFLYRNSRGELKCLWSSFDKDGNYCIGEATSAGDVLGPWTQAPSPVFQADGGHGMVFDGPETNGSGGTRYLAVHTPNASPDERAIFVAVEEDSDGSLRARGDILR